MGDVAHVTASKLAILLCFDANVIRVPIATNMYPYMQLLICKDKTVYSSTDKTNMEQHGISQWFCPGQVQFKPGYFLSDAVGTEHIQHHC